MKFKADKIHIVLGLLVLFNIILHLAVYDNLEYHRDELLYFAMGLHPAFGYATTPPLIGWLASVLQFILGYSLFAVKFIPALASGLIVFLAAKITREFGGHFYAQVLAAITMIFMPFSLRTFHLFQPVFIDLLCWTLIFYVIIRFLNTEKDKYLLIIGYIVGITLLNKYLVGVLLVSLLISLLLTMKFVILKKRAFYYAIGLAFIIFLPNFIWQISNDFRVFQHLQELNQSQLVHVSRGQFLIDQLLMPFAGSLIILPGLIYLLLNKKFRMLGYTALFVITILVILQGKSYYTMGIFPMLVAAGSVAIEKSIKIKILPWAVPLLIIILNQPIIPLGLPLYDTEGLVKYFKQLEEEQGLTVGRTFEDGTIHSLPQDYADQLGWEELTAITNKAYQSLADKNSVFIFASNYGQASAISVIGKKYGLPEAISFNDSYWYWKPDTLDTNIKNLIYINDELGQDVADFFEDITVAGRISNIHAREYGTTVYMCQKPKRPVNTLWQNALTRIAGR